MHFFCNAGTNYAWSGNATNGGPHFFEIGILSSLNRIVLGVKGCFFF